MRILRVAQKSYPEVTGGGAYHVHAMSRDQAARGHDVTVLTVGERGTEERDGYTVERRPATVAALGNDISVGVGRYLRRHADGFDVLHAHSHLYFSTNLAAAVRRLGGPPLAVTNHGLFSQTAPEWVFDAYLRTLGRLTFDSADVVFCYTDADRERLREYGVSTDVAVVPNGIDTERFTPDGPESDLVESSGPVVLFVGRLVEGKRPGDAVAALDRVHERHPEATLYLAGEGPLRGDLEAEVRERGLNEVVTFLGHLDYEVMPALYRRADVLVLPSRAEGLPRTVMEALACRTPVVASDLPQLRSLLDGVGRTFPVGEVDALATALDELLGDPSLRAELGARGRERVVADHAWRTTVERTTERLRDIAGLDGA